MIGELLGLASTILGGLGVGAAGFAVGKKIEKTKGGKEYDKFLNDTVHTAKKIENAMKLKDLTDK